MATTPQSAARIAKARLEVASINRDFNLWIIWGFLIPIAVALLIWIISAKEGVKESFAANFAGADVLVIAAMLLITVTQDIEKIPEQVRLGAFGLTAELFRGISVLIWMVYGYLKLDSLKKAEIVANRIDLKIDSLAEATINSELMYYGIFSMLLLVLFALTAIFVRYRIKEFQVKSV